MKHYDVVGLGQCTVDILCPIENFPENDQKHETGNFTFQGGGPVATALVALSRLGLKTAFIGRTGTDPFGEMIKTELENENVNCDNLIPLTDKTSQTAFVMANKSTGDRTILWNRGTCFPMEKNAVCEDMIANSRFLHLDGLHIEASIKAAEFAKKNNVPVMLDAGTLRKEIFDLLPLVDYAIVGEGFGKALADDIQTAVDKLSEFGVKIAGVTLGKCGSLFKINGEYIKGHAFKVDSIDTTGCGDAFHAGLIYGLLNQTEFTETINFAAALSAIKSTKLGGRTALPDLKTITSFLKNSPEIWR
jgi:ribokinase